MTQLIVNATFFLKKSRNLILLFLYNNNINMKIKDYHKNDIDMFAICHKYLFLH